MGGFFGTIGKKECIYDLYYGTDYNSHMGTKRAGMATWTEESFSRSIHSLENSYFRTKFENELDRFTGKSGIGIISDTDPQPMVMNSHLGKYAVVTVAKINNLDELEKELIDNGRAFTELSSGQTNPTELICYLIDAGKTFAEGIENVFNKVKGSCSLLILTTDGIIVARDKMGRIPVIIGKKEDTAYCISSEPCGFPNLGYEIVYNLGPGEIMHVTADGYTQLRKPNKKKQICSFLWVYYGYPVSEYEGINVDSVRFLGGESMAKEDNLQADFVAGIPDSGVGHALGYAVGKGVPYKRAFIKYTPTWPRSFTPSRQEQREFIAKMKLIPNKTLLKDQRIIFCDDSIVRGTQLRDNVNILYHYGCKEVHMRIACPPLLYACEYLNFTASKSTMELITRQIIKRLEGEDGKNLELYRTTGTPEYNHLVEEIRKELNITTLKFNSLENLVKAIGLPKEELCTHCWDGSSCFD